MSKRCTERVKRVIRLAREAAARYRHAYHGTAHLLLGMRTDGGEDGEHWCTAGGLASRADPHGVERHLIFLVVMLGALGMAGCYSGNDGGARRLLDSPPSSPQRSLVSALPWTFSPF